MPIRRHFLDWQRPALESAAEFLVGTSPACDWGDWIVALPNSRAARRLLELLVEAAEQRGTTCTPPRLITLGHLPEQLYEAKFPFAPDLVQHLAWIQALSEMTPAEVEPLFRQLPETEDLRGRLAVGEMLAKLHTELAADGLDFQDVVRRGGELPSFDEHARWAALAQVQTRYLSLLDELELWDLQTARLFAIKHRESRSDRRILLIGAVDMNQALRQMLDQVADQVTALVVAPDALADWFDEHGCVRPARWSDEVIPLRAEQIHVVDGPADQADEVLHLLRELNGEYGAADIVVGVGDEQLVPYLEQRLDDAGLPQRYGAGAPVARSAPILLLAAIAQWLERGRYEDFAALVRHPAVEGWLLGRKLPGNYLSRLDEYFSDRLPHGFPRTGLPDEIQPLRDAIDAWLQPLTVGRRRKLQDWGPSVVEVMLAVYGDKTWNLEDPAARQIVRACEALQRVLAGHQELAALVRQPGMLAGFSLIPELTASEALHLILRDLADAQIPPPQSETAIELLGWLELPLDDAPVLIVTGFNEGRIPSAQNGDLFLPNELRRHLNLIDNDRRLARDAYALHLLRASRRVLHVVAGRRSVNHDPLLPSRLLFNCPDDQLPQRTRQLLSVQPSRGRPPGRLLAGRAALDFPVPRPEPLDAPIEAMKVTEFRNYLTCPYRYYLRHRLNLQAQDDASEELDNGGFGSLIHSLLQRFAEGPACHAADADVIRGALSDDLDRFIAARFGDDPLAAVLIQVEQIRLRLQAFADWQANWAAQGWQIAWTEREREDLEADFEVDGRPFKLRGRIDRIDRNTRTGAWAILDYKTSESGRSPDAVHRKKDEWVDLQLPLYRHLAKALAERDLHIEGDVKLGYVILPKSLGDTGAALAEWSEDQLAAADEVAREVVRGVRAERFWPPRDPAPAFSEVYAAICQDDSFSPAVPDEDAPEEEEESP